MLVGAMLIFVGTAPTGVEEVTKDMFEFVTVDTVVVQENTVIGSPATNT